MAGLGFSSSDIFLWIFVPLGEFQMPERDAWEIVGPLQAHPAQREQMSRGQNKPGSTGDVQRTRSVSGVLSSGLREGGREGVLGTAAAYCGALEPTAWAPGSCLLGEQGLEMMQGP